MILTENRKLLKKYLPDLLKQMEDYEKEKVHLSNVELEQTRTEFPTLRCQKGEDEFVYLHSKYNPIQEVDRVISQYKDFRDYTHVFFYGVGLGYHIEIILNLYLHLEFTLYEPDIDVLYQFLCHRSLESFPIQQLKKWYIEKKPDDFIHNIEDFMSSMNEKVLFIPWPSYKGLYPERYENFSTSFRETAANKRFSMQTDLAYEKRWTINSIANLPEIVNTPNMLLGKQKYFKNKPAIIVSAGPSLVDEIEHLRQIKENGSAYIFSVGSANKALIAHGIYPDAACTYDPNPWNDRVFDEIINQGIASIPLIFGSSVGFETLNKYPGPKLHMITNQDFVSPYYLKSDQYPAIPIVRDAPTIAIVTLELLIQLECEPIILVGQNFAFRNNQFYAKGISYEGRSEGAVESELKDAFLVKDVYDHQVLTNWSLNQMRKGMEQMIRLYEKLVINTTKGGAQITGTEYIPLEQVMQAYLKESVVDPVWPKLDNTYSQTYLSEKNEDLYKEYRNLDGIFQQLFRIFKKMEQGIRWKNAKSLNTVLEKFDRVIIRMEKNEFYKQILKLMNRVQFELLNRTLDRTRKEEDLIKKVEIILQDHQLFIYDCYRDYQDLKELFTGVYQIISKMPSNEGQANEYV